MTHQHLKGFALIELLAAVVIATVLLVAMYGVLNQGLDANLATQTRNGSIQSARFAMQRMIGAVGDTHLLLLPLVDKPMSNWPEHIREETVPASAPIGDSTKATAVLAIALSANIDLNDDGDADADNDSDGRIDEDLPSDNTFDSAPGIYLIDDDGDGSVDEGNNDSDDESSTVNDDAINGIDDDSDNNVDEDSNDDNNGDGCPGICGVDDDGDSQIDEGSNENDDEDGQTNEDWLDAVVFYLQGDELIERTPVPWDENSSGSITGRDYVETKIAENVTRFRVERIPLESNRAELIDITLEITSQEGETFSLNSRVRVGGKL